MHSCAEIYVPHSKKPLKSSSLLASSQALCAWEIKCLRANSQFITDLTEEKPLLVWEHPLPNHCISASLFIASFIYLKFLISLGLHFARMLHSIFRLRPSPSRAAYGFAKMQPWPICWTYKSDSANSQKFPGTYVNTNCIDRDLFLLCFFPKEKIETP